MGKLFRFRNLAHCVPMLLDDFEHRCDVVFRYRLCHAAGTRIVVTWERPHRPRQSRALLVGFASHDRSDCATQRSPLHTVVTVAVTHDERAEIRVTESEGTENMRVLRDFFDWVARVIDDNLLRSNEDAHRSLET